MSNFGCNLFCLSSGLRPHPQKRWRKDECAKAIGLVSSKQIRICRNNVDLMPFVEESIRLVKGECKEQFAQRIWDCSSVEKAPKFGFDLRSGLSRFISLLPYVLL